MDERIKKLIELTKTKFGLGNYYLKRYSIERNLTIFNETKYILSMEWFPDQVTVDEDDELNPEGTAVIEMDIHTQQFNSAIFVGGKTYADNGVTFDDLDINIITNWIEKETRLTYGKHFQLKKEEENRLLFEECIDGIAVSPGGFIDVEWDSKGQLTSFTVHGNFPSKALVNEEKYTLSLQKMEEIAKEQLQLVYFPSFEKECLIPVYAVEESYITNENRSIIPFQRMDDRGAFVDVNQILDWQTPLDEAFERKEIDWNQEITTEQAFAQEPSPDAVPISPEEEKESVQAVIDFLRKVYPDDTGKWRLHTLSRKNGYLHALLKLESQTNLVFQTKLLLVIDTTTSQVVHFMDTQDIEEMFDSFQKLGEVRVTKVDAYNKLKKEFQLKPCYVFDRKENQYLLCGAFDCHYGIHAINGEVVALNEL
ncbi:hypothetical protein [Gracilibacillus thailandensis]|uniref:DUF4901 domain-containing protein n=1 Tax=Gracilibacillus thailandensis TaxID=563735 RepID=A0A6N7R2B8_9BACI|nr:hypothetical protein [Gracilibacillus thailandensis]MRI66749.1 hypothetical protein [Gracilibacillus thailandensis]